MATLILTANGRPNKEALLTMRTKCPKCGRRATVTIWEDKYRLVMEGEDLNYTPEDAELIRTGTCHSCYRA